MYVLSGINNPSLSRTGFYVVSPVHGTSRVLLAFSAVIVDKSKCLAVTARGFPFQARVINALEIFRCDKGVGISSALSDGASTTSK